MAAACMLLELMFLFIRFSVLSATVDGYTGWKGDPRIEWKTSRVSSSGAEPRKVINLSWKPRAFLYKGFLSDEECQHLINLAKQSLGRSTVSDSDFGSRFLSDVRTSSGTFIRKDQDEIVMSIESRISAWTFTPKENGEPLQVLKYRRGGKYEPHFDYFREEVDQARGGHRVATVLMYLTDVNKGGETVFPKAERGLRCSKEKTLSDCATQGLAVKPRKGDALLFYNLLPDATPDPLSLHAGCPVTDGEKWSATKWIHVSSYDDISEGTKPGCEDEHENCGEWALLGDCRFNPDYMVGTQEHPGWCRKSCRVC